MPKMPTSANKLIDNLTKICTISKSEQKSALSHQHHLFKNLRHSSLGQRNAWISTEMF